MTVTTTTGRRMRHLDHCEEAHAFSNESYRTRKPELQTEGDTVGELESLLPHSQTV